MPNTSQNSQVIQPVHDMRNDTVIELTTGRAKHSPNQFTNIDNILLLADVETEEDLKCIITTLLFLGIVISIFIVAFLFNPEM